MLASSTVVSKTCHPSYVFIHVISAHHVQNFTNVLLMMFILKFVIEGLVCLLQERICLFKLVSRWESFIGSCVPRFAGIELGRIFILSQVHSERNFVFGQFATMPDQMVIIRRITNEVDVGVGRCIHWLSALSASLYFLELGASGLYLTSSVLGFLNTSIVVCGNEVVIAGQNGSPLLCVVLFFEQLTFLDSLTKPLLLFLQISLIEAGRVVNYLWLLLLLCCLNVT